MIVDPVSCTASNHRCFDTHIGAAPTQDLVNYINYVRTGALLVGVTGDEPMLNIGSALSLLRVAGVEVADVQNRGSFAFVIQIGYPEKTVFAKSQPTGQYSSLNVIVRGETVTALC